MADLLQEVAVSLVDVNGNPITSMSNVTVLEGYSTAIKAFGARAVICEWRDTAVGTSVAPTAVAVGVRNSGAAYYEDINFGSARHNGGNMVATFWRSPAGRIVIYPHVAGFMPSFAVFPFDELRIHVTIGATANLFTPVLRAWVLQGAAAYPLPT